VKNEKWNRNERDNKDEMKEKRKKETTKIDKRKRR
jgi:hypothetical protein